MRTLSVAIAMLATLGTATAHAEVLDLGKVSCGAFAAMDGVSKTNVAVWLNGYYMNENDDPIINWDKVNDLGNALVKYCAANAEMKLSDAAEKLMGKSK